MKISERRFGILVAIYSLVFLGLLVLLLGSLQQAAEPGQFIRLGLLLLVVISFFGLLTLVQARVTGLGLSKERRQTTVERSINRVRTTIGIWMNSTQKTPKVVTADINLLIREEPKLPLQIRELLLRVKEEAEKLQEEIVRDVIYWDLSTHKVSSKAKEELDSFLKEVAL